MRVFVSVLFWKWVLIFAIYVVTLELNVGRARQQDTRKPGKSTKGKDLEEGRRDGGETN